MFPDLFVSCVPTIQYINALCFPNLLLSREIDAGIAPLLICIIKYFHKNDNSWRWVQRQGLEPSLWEATSHYLNEWRPSWLTHIYAAIRVDELIHMHIPSYSSIMTIQRIGLTLYRFLGDRPATHFQSASWHINDRMLSLILYSRQFINCVLSKTFSFEDCIGHIHKNVRNCV